VLDLPVEALRPLERKLVELAAAVSESPELLLLDEPTTDLGPHESRHFLATVRSVATELKIPAVFTSASPRDGYPDVEGVTILWRGADPATVTTGECSEGALVERWTGGVGIRRAPMGHHTPGEPILRAEGIVIRGRGRETSLAGLDFEVKAGEVLAIVGAPADGLDLLHDVLLGSRVPERGSMQFLGKETIRWPRRLRVEAGIGFVSPPYSRDQSIGDFSIEENLILGQTGSMPFSRRGFIRRDSIRGNAVRTLRDFEIPDAEPQHRFRDLKLGERQRYHRGAGGDPESGPPRRAVSGARALARDAGVRAAHARAPVRARERPHLAHRGSRGGDARRPTGSGYSRRGGSSGFP
jgi:ABC-type uncharacterized transport system ATPase subunit